MKAVNPKIAKSKSITLFCAVSLCGIVFGSANLAYSQNSPGSNRVASEIRKACENLKSASFDNTTLTVSDIVAAGTFTAPKTSGPGPGFPADYSHVPAFCRVAGTIKPTPSSDIRFELWLPVENWNGKFMQTGNGGAAGSIVINSLIEPLTRGYAVANTDTGHQGGAGNFSWAVENPEKLTDFAYRAVHELTLMGKAITTAYFGKAPEKSYWNGCSTGGRQGLKEAQFYPQDYDAIIAGSPASNWQALMAQSIEIKNNLGPMGLSLGKLALLKEAAIKACDALDGVSDRVISDPTQCSFDPGSLKCKDGITDQCLSDNEISAAKDIYDGLKDSRGEIMHPGMGTGGELQWAAYASPGFSIGEDFFRYVVIKDKNWDPTTFDVDKDLAHAEQLDNGAIKAMDPDLSPFIKRGGKLILYHGTVDGLITHGNTVNYFNSVVNKLGKNTVDDHVKFYLIPGMGHCSGGEGAYSVDWLTALEQWDETGKVPSIEGKHLAGPSFGAAPPARNVKNEEFTRPICPYPQRAVYKGQGDNTLAENFECAVP